MVTLAVFSLLNLVIICVDDNDNTVTNQVTNEPYASIIIIIMERAVYSNYKRAWFLMSLLSSCCPGLSPICMVGITVRPSCC